MNDIFISYAHIDNEALTEEDKGWISQFHKVLDTRVAQLTGEKPRIWRDLKLGGFPLGDLKYSGYTPKELLAVGFTQRDLKVN